MQRGLLVEYLWMIELIVVVFLLFFCNFLLKKMVLRSKSRSEMKEKNWLLHLDYALLTPARALLWILLIAFAADLLIREFQVSGFCFVGPFRNAAIIFCLAWFILRWKRVLQRVALEKPEGSGKGKLKLDPFTIEMTSKLCTIFVIFLSLLLIMSIFGLNIVPLITFGGIGAAILGIAGKDVIANFFGGFMIYLTRPFCIGDEIEFREKRMRGKVEEIGWYFTSIRDSLKQPIYIPNAVFSTEPLMNLSRITHRRIEESIGVRYEDMDKIPAIIQEIRSLLENHKSVDQTHEMHVFLEKFGDVAVHIEVKAYLLSTRYEEFMEQRQEVLRSVYRIVQQAGAQIPYPTMQIKMVGN